MQSLFNHYQVGRFFRTFAFSCYEPLRFVYCAARPYVITTWRILSSREARAVYRFLWRSLLALLAIVALTAFIAGGKFREWCDERAQSSPAPAATPDQPDQPDQQTAKTATIAEMEPWDAPVEPAPTKTPTSPTQLPTLPTPILALPPAKTAPVVVAEAKQPKKRGRPKGSKNKAL